MDGKYGNLRAVDQDTKWDDDEPLFLIRGQDKLAVEALFAYALLARAHRCHAVALGVDQQMRKIREWQRTNPDRVKLPD